MGDLSEVHAESPPDADTFYIPRIWADDLRRQRDIVREVLTAMMLNGWGTEQALMECYA